MSSSKLTKEELRNILEDGWGQRREKLKARRVKQNEHVLKWKKQEELVKAGKIKEPKRRKNYIQEPLITAPQLLSPTFSTP